MSASQYFARVQEFYIAYYQRPADASGMLFWADRINVSGGDTNAVEQAFANTPESLALYGPINNSTISAVVTKMYQADFGRAPDPAGLAFYVNGFISGKFTAVDIAISIYDGAQGNDAVILNNKEIVANDFTQTQDGRSYADPTFGQGTQFAATYAGTADATAARAMLATITSSPTTILSNAQVTSFIQNNIANPGDPILFIAPTWTFTSDVTTVDEGGTVTFTLNTTNVAIGTTYNYVLNSAGTPLTAADVVGGLLTGTVQTDSTGKAVVQVTLAKDNLSEPTTEKISIGLVGVTLTSPAPAVTVLDTSQSPTTFILTPGIDVPPAYEGTAADDLFVANGDTLNPGDNLQGGGGHNTFNYASGNPGGSVFENGFVTGDIQAFNLTADADLKMDMSGVSGIEIVTDINSRENVRLTNGNAIHDLHIVNTTVAHNVRVDYQASTVAAGSDVQNITANVVLAGTDIRIDGVETINLDVANGVAIDKLEDNALVNLNLDGSGDLSIQHITFNGAGHIVASNMDVLDLPTINFGAGNSSVDATDLGGPLDLTLGNASASGRNVAVTGSDYGDYLRVEAGFNSGDSFDGRGGDDEIYLDPSNFAVGANAITNTEYADLASGTLTTFDLGQFDTALEVVEVNTWTASTVTFLNIENDGSELFSVDNYYWGDPSNQIVRFDPVTSGFGGLTVNMEVYDIDSPTTVHFQDFDAVKAANQDPVGTLNLTLWGDSTFTADLDPMNALTTLGLAGSADIVVTADAATVTTVNGAETTGNVTITAGVLSNGGATVVLGSGYDVVYGGSGNDNIDIGTGGGFVDGGNGNDTITGSGFGSVEFTGGEGSDTLTGGEDGDDLYGGNGADTLTGNGGDDYLQGDGGIDSLAGGAGEDTLYGGTGADQLSGGDDADTFYYEYVTDSQGAPFTDTITDFVSGQDFIDLLPAMINGGTGVLDYNDMRFNGNANGFAAAQGSLSGSGGVEIVYDTAADAVYVDVNGDGKIDGTQDMVILFTSPDTLQNSDFGIDATNNFTAISAGFRTDDATTSFENTVTGPENDYVVAEGKELKGSYARGEGGTDTFTVTTAIGYDFDFADLMNGPPGDLGGDFSRLNLHGGDSSLITGPDQYRNLVVNIGNAGGFFRTGTSNFVGAVQVQQSVFSNSGDDDIRLTNVNDTAETRGGSDFVWAEVAGFEGEIKTGGGDDLARIGSGFDGKVNLDGGDDELEIVAGTTLGSDAKLKGGGQAGDRIEVDGDVDISQGKVTEFAFIDYTGLGTDPTVTLTIDQYNALTRVGNEVEDNIFGSENMTFKGAGTVALDSNLDDVGIGDDSAQTFILGDDETKIVGDVGGAWSGNTTVVSNIGNLNTTYNGGGGTNTFVQNVDADFDDGFDPVFTNFNSLVLNNGSDINDMSDSQHNSFGNAANQSGFITGNDGPFANTNSINIKTTFSGTTQNTIELYTLDLGGTYQVGGSNQTVTDSGVAGSNVTILNSLSNTTLSTSTGADTVTLGSGDSGITINTDGGADTVNAASGGTNITINTGDQNDTVNLGGTHTGISVNTGNDDDTVNLGGIIAGKLDVGAGNNTLKFTNGDWSGLTISNMDATDFVVMSGTKFTFNSTQYTNIITGAPTLSGLVGTETITINDASSVAFSNDILADNGQFKTLVMGSNGNDTVTFKSEASNVVRNLDISAGGNDKITLNNIGFQAADSDSALVVKGFDVSNDQIRLQNNGASNGNYQDIVLSDTDLTIGPNGVIVVNTAVGSLIGTGGALNVLDGGSVESLIAGAVGSTNILGAPAKDFFAVLYASDGAAYVYQVNVTTTDANLNSGDFAVELIGELDQVTANSLGLSNFYA